jgi:hypothetical protein
MDLWPDQIVAVDGRHGVAWREAEDGHEERAKN